MLQERSSAILDSSSGKFNKKITAGEESAAETKENSDQNEISENGKPLSKVFLCLTQSYNLEVLFAQNNFQEHSGK